MGDLCQEWSKVSSASALWEASTAVASDRRAFGVMYTPLGSCETDMEPDNRSFWMIWGGTIVELWNITMWASRFKASQGL